MFLLTVIIQQIMNILFSKSHVFSLHGVPKICLISGAQLGVIQGGATRMLLEVRLQRAGGKVTEEVRLQRAGGKVTEGWR
jgi:hypothetical protein